jgi:dTDP-glucose 4,6-dehydratase
MAKVIITGGLGFMGSDFARMVCDHGLASQIIIVDNFSYSSDISRLSGYLDQVEIVKADIRDEEKILSLTKNADFVFNFAAESHNDNSIDRPLDFLSTNTLGTSNLLQSARKNGFHLHQVSTDEVFGDLPLSSGEFFSETSPHRPSSPYSASKAAAEMLALGWQRTFGLRVTISNSSNNYGEFQHSEKLIPNMLKRLRLGLNPALYGDGKNIRDWLYVRDHSAAVWLIATSNASLRYCISSGQEHSNREIASILNRLFGRDENAIDFVADRPGHDKKYSSSSRKLKEELDWSPVGPTLETWLANEVEKFL